MIKKTFRLVRGSLSWSETPYFHTNGYLWSVPLDKPAHLAIVPDLSNQTK